MTIHTPLAPALALIRVAPRDGTSVQLVVHRPAQPRGWLVWAHGGSWQYGSALGWAPITQALATAAGWGVVSVDYRLAPTHRFPAAALDMLAALDWTERQAASHHVAVGGDSAGGTIATLAALARRDAGEWVPSQMLTYPPLDPGCVRPSYRAFPSQFPSSVDLRAAWRLWLGSEPRDPSLPDSLIRPTLLQAGTLAGLSPVSLVVGANDPVRDDVIAYADLLRADGVATTLRVLPGVGHADLLNPGSHVLQAAAAALSGFAPDSRTASPKNGNLS